MTRYVLLAGIALLGCAKPVEPAFPTVGSSYQRVHVFREHHPHPAGSEHQIGAWQHDRVDRRRPDVFQSETNADCFQLVERFFVRAGRIVAYAESRTTSAHPAACEVMTTTERQVRWRAGSCVQRERDAGGRWRAEPCTFRRAELRLRLRKYRRKLQLTVTPLS